MSATLDSSTNKESQETNVEILYTSGYIISFLSEFKTITKTGSRKQQTQEKKRSYKRLL